RRENQEGQTRFFMLETIREFAQQQLESSGRTEAVHQSHATYFLRLAQQAQTHLQGTNQAPWLKCLKAEHGNVQAVIRHSLDCDDVETALRLIDALWFYWVLHGHVDEGWKWSQEILARPDGKANPILLAQASTVIAI